MYYQSKALSKDHAPTTCTILEAKSETYIVEYTDNLNPGADIIHMGWTIPHPWRILLLDIPFYRVGGDGGLIAMAY